MTKAEIKKLIIDSDYKNQDVVIWWTCQFMEKPSFLVAVWSRNKERFDISLHSASLTLSQLVNNIFADSQKSNFKIKIVEVGDD